MHLCLDQCCPTYGKNKALRFTEICMSSLNDLQPGVVQNFKNFVTIPLKENDNKTPAEIIQIMTSNSPVCITH